MVEIIRVLLFNCVRGDIEISKMKKRSIKWELNILVYAFTPKWYNSDNYHVQKMFECALQTYVYVVIERTATISLETFTRRHKCHDKIAKCVSAMRNCRCVSVCRVSVFRTGNNAVWFCWCRRMVCVWHLFALQFSTVATSVVCRASEWFTVKCGAQKDRDDS